MKSFSHLLALSLLIVAVTSVQAHSTLERSEPKNGAVLKQAPNEIRMWFSEPIKVTLSTIEVRDGSGKQVDGKDARADAREPSLVHLSLAPNLGTGTYKVSWTAVAQDMHVAKGSFSFRVAP
ncbi:MAG: copper resistance protein CopC [Chthoniobacterales bacterium]